MPEVKLPQGTVNVRDTGTGEPIVFVHGLLTDGRLWRKVTPPLGSVPNSVSHQAPCSVLIVKTA